MPTCCHVGLLDRRAIEAADGEDASPAAPRPVAKRCNAAAACIDRDLYIFGGEAGGDLVPSNGDPAYVDMSDKEMARWAEPEISGTVPGPRKNAAAAATAGRIVMFGGTAVDAEEAPVVLEELCVMTVLSPGVLSSVVNPEVSGPAPCARTGAVMVEHRPGRVFLYGGFAADGRALNDAYVLDVETMAWTRVYNGHPDLVGPTGGCCLLRLLSCSIGAVCLAKWVAT